MEIRGTLTYCNRCGFKIFRKGNLNFALQGYYWSDIDELPEGWKVFGDKHLCPECGKAWEMATMPRSKEEKKC